MQNFWLLFMGVILTLLIPTSLAWKRSSLIYTLEGRNQDAWKRHLMRVDASGSFTGQWLFDSAILTAEKINDKDIYFGNSPSYLTGQDLSDLIETLITDANNMESALTSLSSQFGNPRNHPIQIFIGFPYLHAENRNLQIEGVSYDLSNPERRIAAARWYLDRLRNRLRSKTWRFFNFGVYYHREDILPQFGDAEYVKSYNDYIHQLNMESLWVPYYVSPQYAFNGTQVGFDSVIVQPTYSFLNSIDAGVLKGDRLYGAGYKAASHGLCIEYEARSHGETEVEHYVAHQYLAISQFTGCDQYKQTYFFGKPDIFDKVTSQASAPGKVWDTYQDLANYLGGQQIPNLEVGINANFRDVNANRKELNYVVNGNYLENLNAVRLDFNDNDGNRPWRGRLVVLVEGSQARSSFAYRMGSEDVNPEYNSVFVPLSNEKVSPGSNLLIRLEREAGSPWPNILRLVATKYEPLFIANPVAYSISSSSVPVTTNSYQDSVNTQSGYASGKLTDGGISSSWGNGNVVGWNQMDHSITITIDLGSVRRISQVRAHAWSDIGAGIAFPRKMGALAAADCEPQERGTLNGCVPIASSGTASVEVQSQACGRLCHKGIFSSRFGDSPVSARYVTISFVAMAWAILDEVQILDENNQVISGGRPYRVTPVPGNYRKESNADLYTSDGQNLADGAVFKDFIYGRNVVGIPKNQEGNVELIWVKPLQNMSRAIIWMTNAKPKWEIGLPSTIIMQWRNQNGVWQQSTSVSVSGVGSGVCTASPCASLALPRGARVTGVRGRIPATNMMTMITEISLM